MMLELMLEKYLIETIPRGAAREIIIRMTKATYILVGEFILLCRSNRRDISNIEEYKALYYPIKLNKAMHIE